MFDLKVINSVLDQFEEEKNIPRTKMIEAIEAALATAYKKEYGKRNQIIRSSLDMNVGTPVFEQIKQVVDESLVYFDTEEERAEDDERTLFDSEKHILLEDAQRMKKDAELGSELAFPLELKEDFGRIAAQTAKQVIIQKIREAEKSSILEEFAGREGEIVSGTVQRVERGMIYVDLGRTTGIIPFEEQIRGERYRTGERIRAYLYSVDEGARGVFLRLSRAQPQFVVELFKLEAPELANGTVVIKAIAREPGSRTKLAVISEDSHIDPVGSLVGQRGVRVSTVTSELGGERIDIMEWSDDEVLFVKDALSPAEVTSVELDEKEHKATVTVTEDQQSLAIGRGGQNVRLAAKLTGWSIDIASLGGDNVAETDGAAVEVAKEEVKEPTNIEIDTSVQSAAESTVEEATVTEEPLEETTLTVEDAVKHADDGAVEEKTEEEEKQRES
ncbi:transcription termination factor NusA [Candidatus Wolfebacteria bacterium]|nr:transcription termination factor NusA [Candidatus Wolfebacteria bacterium]